jgi:Fur family ferric uptake transcriptional regulator
MRHRRILSECLDLLELNGVETDGPVESIIRHFFSTDQHVSIQDMVAYANRKKIAISPSEIEETMHLLVDYGFAARKDFGRGRVLFEHLHLDEHHDHLLCTKCGKITEFHSEEMERLQNELAVRSGFHALYHKMQIHGLCSDCFGASAKAALPLSEVEPGIAFRVEDIQSAGSRGLGGRRRIEELGIYPGTRGTVITKGLGTLVVNVAGRRIALGRGQSKRVVVGIEQTL